MTKAHRSLSKCLSHCDLSGAWEANVVGGSTASSRFLGAAALRRRLHRKSRFKGPSAPHQKAQARRDRIAQLPAALTNTAKAAKRASRSLKRMAKAAADIQLG